MNNLKIPFFDLKRLYRLTEHDIDREIRHVLESGHYILGSYCQKFELALKESLVLKQEGYAIGCNSGTDALILPLLALDVGPGDEVITVSHTAIPTVTAIRSTGAKPVFCDVHPTRWVMDIEKVPSLLTVKTKAIVAVHIYGNMVDIFKLKEILKSADRSDVKIIEDVAQAQGSRWKLNGVEHPAGTIGDFGAFSFYPTKNLGALGDAGAVFTKNPEWAEKIKMLRFYGQKDRYNALIDRGLNSRLDELQAAILETRMKFMNKWEHKKEDMVNAYRNQLDGLPLEFQEVDSHCEPHWHLFVVKNKSQFTRDEVIQKLEAKGVQALIHYPIPTHKQKAFSQFADKDLPVTETLAQSILSLPMNVALLPEELEHTVKTLREIF